MLCPTLTTLHTCDYFLPDSIKLIRNNQDYTLKVAMITECHAIVEIQYTKKEITSLREDRKQLMSKVFRLNDEIDNLKDVSDAEYNNKI